MARKAQTIESAMTAHFMSASEDACRTLLRMMGSIVDQRFPSAKKPRAAKKPKLAEPPLFEGSAKA